MAAASTMRTICSGPTCRCIAMNVTAAAGSVFRPVCTGATTPTYMNHRVSRLTYAGAADGAPTPRATSTTMAACGKPAVVQRPHRCHGSAALSAPMATLAAAAPNTTHGTPPRRSPTSPTGR